MNSLFCADCKEGEDQQEKQKNTFMHGIYRV